MRLMETDLTVNVSTAALAQAVGLGQSRFIAGFSDRVGVSPHQWCLSLRIERAKCLLADMRLSVTKIGYDLGFSDPAHFAMTFKKRVGMTPSAWREANVCADDPKSSNDQRAVDK
jgi:AraC family transcriptional regulator